jgi:hypothetical protein
MLKKNLFGDTEAYLIFDDTVINNNRTYVKALLVV